MVTVRSVPVPVKARLAFGTTSVLLDVPVTVSVAAGVSVSFIVKLTAIGVSSSVV